MDIWVKNRNISKKEVQLEPFQERAPCHAQMSIQESELINQAVVAMLTKQVPKKDGGNMPVINLKTLYY